MIAALNKVALDCERFIELLQFLGWKSLTSFRIKCDNKSTIALCKKKCGPTKLSRAFRLRNDDLLDMYNEKILEVEHISGTENPADGFTKAQSSKMFKKFLKYLYPSQDISSSGGG